MAEDSGKGKGCGARSGREQRLEKTDFSFTLVFFLQFLKFSLLGV